MMLEAQGMGLRWVTDEGSQPSGEKIQRWSQQNAYEVISDVTYRCR